MGADETATLAALRAHRAELIEMLERPEGVAIAEIVAPTCWQPHTARGAILGAIKKKLSVKVVSEKVEGRGRV